MALRFAWATFDHDGECCMESVRSVLRLGVRPEACTIGEMPGRELRGPERAALEAMGVQDFRPSGYTRRNTMGDKAGRLRLIAEAGESAEWVLNVDSDTTLQSLDPVLRVMDSGRYVAAATSWPGVPFAGCCSLYRPPAARRCLEALEGENPLGFPPQGGPDDTAAGEMLDHLYGAEQVCRWSREEMLGMWWFDAARDDAEEIRRFPAIHWGQKGRARRLAKGRPVRDVVRDAMRAFLGGLGG